MGETPKLIQGFDRGIEFSEIKDKLVDEYDKINDILIGLKKRRGNKPKKMRLLNRLIYLMIAMIQLRNGSRISEAVEAVYKFLNSDNLAEKVIVKIAKSNSLKYKKDTKEVYHTRTRYRNMIFPANWLKIELIDHIKNRLNNLDTDRLNKRVLDFLLRNFKCNTHSLRYSWINFMLYEKKKEIGIIAKIIGHSNLNQLVRYTQNVQADKIIDEDI